MAIEYDYQNQKLFVNGKEIVDIEGVIAENVPVTPSGVVTATNLQDALEELANQIFKSDEAPVSGNLEPGDIWYETDTESLYYYREVSPSVFAWVPISTGTGTSDILDGGAY